MKLISSFMDDLIISEGKCHTMSFQSSAIQANFRKLIKNYFTNKKSDECNYIKLLNDHGDKIKGKDFYFVSFDCNTIDLKEDRDTEKQIREILHYYLEHNSDLLKEYLRFNKELSYFFEQIEIGKDHLIIDFQPTNKTITQLIRSLDIIVEYKSNDYVPNYILRDFLIHALLDMNILRKKEILLISYPETDIGMTDFGKAMKLLNDLNITTIVITAHPEILTSVSEENMFLVNENGTIYDIITLKNELLELKQVEKENASKVAKMLAYRDFKQDYFLLDKAMKKFLLSDRM